MPADWKDDPVCRHSGAWLTIGSFDGVHLGHQAIIRALVAGARRSNSLALVATFHPHPTKVLKNNGAPFYLSPPDEKDALVRALGVDSVLTLRFNRKLASTSARDFICLLHDQLKFACLLVGYDFRFGAGRQGDFDLLTRIGAEIGYAVHAFEPQLHQGRVVSSSEIRDLIEQGHVHQAAQLLARPYSLTGIVVHGDGRGKHIGLPTANLQVWQQKLLPQTGVYAAFALLEGQRVPSVINIGSRPTFYQQPVQATIEAHLLDFNREIYDRRLRLDFIQRIRAEKKFDSAHDLMVQINQDIQLSREVLAHEPDPTNLSA